MNSVPAGSTLRLHDAPFSELIASREASNEAPWLADLRRRGADEFLRTGIPTTRDEEWRFTPLRALSAIEFGLPVDSPAVTLADLQPFLFSQPDWPRLVVVDGQVNMELSSAPGAGSSIAFGSLAELADSDSGAAQHLGQHATVESTPFTALNAALWTDGGFVRVRKGTLAAPVHIVYVTTSAATAAVVATRSLVLMDPGAAATVIESFVTLTNATYFTNACTEISLGDGARLEHIRVERESPAASHIGFTAVHQPHSGSHYRSFTLAMGGRLSRHNLYARLDAPGVETLLYGLYLARGEQLLDNHTAIFHNSPNCNSWEVYKGVLAERSRGVFNGKVLVHRDAQKTDAKQTNRNLLLSDEAKVDTKPQLEIFADDVRCTHGATVGKLDERQRYYLQTRGIAGRTAQAMLIWAFAAEVLAEIIQPEVRAELEALVHRELDGLIA